MAELIREIHIAFTCDRRDRYVSYRSNISSFLFFFFLTESDKTEQPTSA